MIDPVSALADAFSTPPSVEAALARDPVLRSAGHITVDIPAEWLGQPLHLYAFLQGYRLRTSDSVHKKLEI